MQSEQHVKVDLATGKQSTVAAVCAKRSPNHGCPESPLGISIRTPGGGPVDIVDIGARSYPLAGLTADCAQLVKTVVIASGSDVQLIDAEHQTSRKLSAEGGDLVAISLTYVAWTNFDDVYAVRH